METVKNYTFSAQMTSSDMNLVTILLNECKSTQQKYLIIKDIDMYEIPRELQTFDWVLDVRIINCKILRIDNLPINIEVLRMAKNKIKVIENLPSKLMAVDLSRNEIEKIENIPATVETLLIGDNNLQSLKIPDNILTLDISNNKLTSVPLLSNKIESINLSHNNITHLGRLPNSLTEIYAGFNKISSVNVLPKNLKILEMPDNDIFFIHPILPESLTNVNLENNKIVRLRLPKVMEKCLLSNNRLISLEYPDKFDFVDITKNKINSREIPAYLRNHPDFHYDTLDVRQNYFDKIRTHMSNSHWQQRSNHQTIIKTKYSKDNKNYIILKKKIEI